MQATIPCILWRKKPANFRWIFHFQELTEKLLPERLQLFDSSVDQKHYSNQYLHYAFLRKLLKEFLKEFQNYWSFSQSCSIFFMPCCLFSGRSTQNSPVRVTTIETSIKKKTQKLKMSHLILLRFKWLKKKKRIGHWVFDSNTILFYSWSNMNVAS